MMQAKHRMIGISAALLIAGLLVGLITYSGASHLSTANSASTSHSSAVTNSGVINSSPSLPTPNATEDDLMTKTAKEIVENTPVPRMARSLVNASPEEVASIVLSTGAFPSRGTRGQVVLARRVTLKDLDEMGLSRPNISSIETPPLMLVILKGNFDISNKSGLLMPGTHSSATYIGYIIDLWAGQACAVMASPDGRNFGKALNDPALMGRYQPSQGSQNAETSPVKLYHYGDTLTGIPIGSTDLHSAKFAGWGYYAVAGVSQIIHTADGTAIEPKRPYAQVSFDNSSIATIQQYIDANKQMVTPMSQRSGQVEAWIVFKDYVPADQFRSFAQAYKLTAGVSYLRAIDENPNPLYAPYYKLQIVPPDGKATPLPQATVDSAFNKLHADVPQLSLKGVYATHAWLDAKDLPALAADPSVYYVDLTANAVRDDLAKAGVAGAAQAVVETPAQMLFALVEKPWQSK